MSVAITGWGWRTPPDSAAGSNARFDARTYPCTRAATIARDPAPSKHKRFLRRMGLHAIECAHEAFAMSGATPGDRTGVFVGYGGLRAHWDDMMPALQKQENDRDLLWQRGLKLLSPFWMLQHLSNNAHALLATDLGARGDGVTCGGANAGAQALTCAIRALACGSIDAALVVAYDSLVEPETLVTWTGDRIPGEAAGALVLVREAPAPFALLDVAEGADGSPGEPRAETIAAVVARVSRGETPSEDDAARSLGSATPLVQAIALAHRLRPGTTNSFVAVSTGAPGLAAAIRVSRG